MVAPVEEQTFESFAEFEKFLYEYSQATASTFVVDDRKKIETANRQISDASKHLSVELKYSFLKMTCIKFGDKQKKKNRPVTGACPNQR